MTKAATWAVRVAEWRASGLTSIAFCNGKEFTAGGLRHWAHRLDRLSHAKEAADPPMRVARVTRSPAPSAPMATAPVIVEVDGVRISVSSGFERDALAAVLEVLEARHQRARP